MLYSVLFRFGHIRRWDQCAVYILYSKISTDPGLLTMRHSHRFVVVVIQFLIPINSALLTESSQIFYNIRSNASSSVCHCTCSTATSTSFVLCKKACPEEHLIAQFFFGELKIFI